MVSSHSDTEGEKFSVLNRKLDPFPPAETAAAAKQYDKGAKALSPFAVYIAACPECVLNVCFRCMLARASLRGYLKSMNQYKTLLSTDRDNYELLLELACPVYAAQVGLLPAARTVVLVRTGLGQILGFLHPCHPLPASPSTTALS